MRGRAGRAGMYPSFHALPLQPRGQKRPRSNPIEWSDPEWGADAGPAKVPFRCTAQWETMLEEAINAFGPVLLAACKPVAQIQPRVRYERKFCGKNFAGKRDDHMKFVVEARRATGVVTPNNELIYIFTPKISTDASGEAEATSRLRVSMGNTLGTNTLAKMVSLDAWRKEWRERERLVQERASDANTAKAEFEELERQLVAAIRATLLGVLGPWVEFFSNQFTHREN